MPADPARVAALFDEACELADAELPGFLAARCAGDPALKTALARLLQHDRALPPAFLAAPAVVCPEGHALHDMSEGTRVAGLVLDRELGAGAMGSVFAARDETLERPVAVKRLRAAFGPDGRARVVQEARALARLSHPHVVQVHEVREHAGELLLVMELVEGASLRAWSEQRARDWRALLAAYVQAGRGLAAAHALGIVHGDFKPDNALVGADGRVRVVDFGLAHLVADDDPDAPRFAGTPEYMDREQLRGGRPDPRSDQFAYCVALYTCLFGQRPFPADDLPALLARREHPPARPQGGEVPPAVTAALLRGLADARTDRWPDMDALLAALDRELARDPEADLAVSSRQRRALTLALLLVTLAVDAWIFLRPQPTAFDLTARDLVLLIAGVFAALLLLIAGFWQALRRNRANRQFTGLLVIVLGLMLVHRLIALQLATPVPHVLVGDLLLMAACGAISALFFRARFAAVALLFLVAALAAARDPASAPAIFSAASASTFALALLWWRGD